MNEEGDFSYCYSKHRLWILDSNYINEAVLMSIHILCFIVKMKI